jgi:hypothetical protein
VEGPRPSCVVDLSLKSIQEENKLITPFGGTLVDLSPVERRVEVLLHRELPKNSPTLLPACGAATIVGGTPARDDITARSRVS